MRTRRAFLDKLCSEVRLSVLVSHSEASKLAGGLDVLHDLGVGAQVGDISRG